jgi:hypothetical protein
MMTSLSSAEPTNPHQHRVFANTSQAQATHLLLLLPATAPPALSHTQSNQHMYNRYNARSPAAFAASFTAGVPGINGALTGSMITSLNNAGHVASQKHITNAAVGYITNAAVGSPAAFAAFFTAVMPGINGARTGSMITSLSSAEPSIAASPLRMAATREPPWQLLLIMDLNGTWAEKVAVCEV